MNPYVSIGRWGVLLGFACGVALANMFRNYLQNLKETFDVSFGAFLLIDIFVISLTTIAVRAVIEFTFSKSVHVRRALLNDEYIEGMWIDLVLREGKVVACGIVQFEPEGDALRYCGINYTIDGLFVSSFRSELIYIQWPVIKFKFRGVDRKADNVLPEGFGELQLFRNGKYAHKFSGYSIGIRNNEKVIVEGWRLPAEDEIHLGTVEDRTKMFKELIDQQGYPTTEAGD